MAATVNLLDFDQPAMRQFFTAMGEKSFRANQIMKWIYHHGITDPMAMTDLGKDLRRRLTQQTIIQAPRILGEKLSHDDTRKWIVGIGKASAIETVFIPEADRGTLCVSSQIGCPLDCSFCATGKQGFQGNLNTAEIIGQVWLAYQALGSFNSRRRVITNIVFMGMGEPLLNFDNVVAALNLMTDDLGFGIANKRVTVSTAGMVPQIEQLARVSRVCLAVSLHAPNDDLRSQLMPINRSYPVADLIKACKRYSKAAGGASITFEYVMLDGVNDSAAEARALADLLRGLPAKVNLIPFNPFADSGYTRSPQGRIDHFRDILMKAGLITITRKTRGDDINAACGQLAGTVVARAARHQKGSVGATL